MSYHNDAEEIAKRLEDDLESILNKYWPSYIVVRGKALLTPKINPKSKTKKPTSSFTVDMQGNKRGQWYRFSQSVGGGSTSLLYYGEHGRVPNSKEDWAEAFREAREFLGIAPQRQQSEENKEEREKRRQQEADERAVRAAKDAEEKAKKDAVRSMNAAQVWENAGKLAGSLGEAYLVGRGVPPIAEWPWDCHEVLRFHPALNYELDRHAGRFPAVIGRVQDAFGETIAIWQIFLDPKEPRKADLENPKLGRGPAAGGAVRIGGDGERVGVAEGMETAIALWVLEGFRKPIWATLSTSGMRAFEPPRKIRHVSIYPDGDKGLVHKQSGKILDPPGIDAANDLFRRMKAIDVGSNINEMTLLGDGLDLLNTRNEYDKTKLPTAEEKRSSHESHQSGSGTHPDR